MAFSQKEQEIIRYGMENGKTKEEVQRALIRFRTNSPSSSPAAQPAEDPLQDRLARVGEQAAAGIQEQISGGSSFAEVPRRAVKATAEAFTTIPKAAFELLPQGLREALSSFGKKAGEVVQENVIDPLAETELIKGAAASGETKGLEEALGTAAAAGEIADTILLADGAALAGKTTVNAADAVAGATQDALTTARERVGTLFSRPSKDIEDVIAQASRGVDDTPPPPPPGAPPAEVRAYAEATTPGRTLQEKWIGISPDIKRRIAGKQDRLQEYFDVAHARNADDTLPGVYEYGAQQADKAVSQMETLLSETGGKIGETRAKLGSYKAAPEQVQRIEDAFVSQLERLNLEVRGGTIRQKPGTITKAGTGDLNVLNTFYKDLRTLKESPTLTNLIDYRSALDSRVNFAKSAREASNEIDPVARKVRSDIADVAAEVVGKTEAAEVKRFSDFMDAYNDLKGYTDRRAGGEYLLRLVLSGRGGEARQIIQTIKEYTGIDLMDDATMMTVAADVIANPRQQNLFRQEVTKAGLDAARILSGDVKGGAAGLLSDLVTKQLLDQEKIYLEAAR